jgi:hypothetical protein
LPRGILPRTAAGGGQEQRNDEECAHPEFYEWESFAS